MDEYWTVLNILNKVIKNYYNSWMKKNARQMKKIFCNVIQHHFNFDSIFEIQKLY